MTGQLFWVVLVQEPNKAEKDNGELTSIVKGPTLVCAKDDKGAVAKATCLWNTEMVLMRTEVVVVPFV